MITQNFAYDGSTVWAILSGSTILVLYVSPSPGDLEARVDSTNGVLWYVTDYSGSVLDLVNDSGAAVERLKSGGYQSAAGSGQTNWQPAAGTVSGWIPNGSGGWTQVTNYVNAAPVNDMFTSATSWVDPATGMQWNGAKFYDPGAGRYINEDPQGLAAANYVEQSGNPTNTGSSIGAMSDFLDGATTFFTGGAALPNLLSGLLGGAIGANGLLQGVTGSSAQSVFGGIQDWWFRNNVGTRLEGALQVAVGLDLAIAGVGIAVGGTILGYGVGGVVAIPVGGGIAALGVDQVIAGSRKLYYGQEYESFVGQAIDGTFGGGGQTYDIGIGFATLAGGAAKWAFGASRTVAAAETIALPLVNGGERFAVDAAEIAATNGMSLSAIKALIGACFAAGEKLYACGTWGEGWREIEKIARGDKVLSRNENDPNGPLVWKDVEELFTRNDIVHHVAIRDPEGVPNRVIRTTGEHPFFRYNDGWTAAVELKRGDLIATREGIWVEVEEVVSTGEWETVYNLRVADFHTYFVGRDGWGFGVWAHNACSIIQQIRNLSGTVGGNVSRLVSMMASGIKSFSIGGYAQARQALLFAQKGILEAIEFTLASGRKGDLLLRGGTAVEIKSWTQWSNWLPQWQTSKVANLQAQIFDYLRTPGVNRLMVQFESSIPDLVTQMINGLPAAVRSRVYLRTF